MRSGLHGAGTLAGVQKKRQPPAAQGKGKRSPARHRSHPPRAVVMSTSESAALETIRSGSSTWRTLEFGAELPLSLDELRPSPARSRVATADSARPPSRCQPGWPLAAACRLKGKGWPRARRRGRPLLLKPQSKLPERFSRGRARTARTRQTSAKGRALTHGLELDEGPQLLSWLFAGFQLAMIIIEMNSSLLFYPFGSQASGSQFLC